MKTKELMLRVQELFELKLQAKTSWGRNEVMEAYRAAVSEALMEALGE